MKQFLKLFHDQHPRWNLDPIDNFPRPELHGTFIQKDHLVVRVMYNEKEKRFYLARTNSTNPQEMCFFDHPDPFLVAQRIFQIFP